MKGFMFCHIYIVETRSRYSLFYFSEDPDKVLDEDSFPVHAPHEAQTDSSSIAAEI